MRLHLGIGVTEKPSLKTLTERLRKHADRAAAGQASLAFLLDHERLLDVPILIEDGLYIAEIDVPMRNRQQPLVAPSRPARRAANLREEESPLDQELVDEISSALEASEAAGRELAVLSSTLSAVELPGAVREFERKRGVDSRPLLKDMSSRTEPMRVEIIGQGEFDFPAPPAVRKTVVSDVPVAVYLRPSASKAALDLPFVIMHKESVRNAPRSEKPEERLPDDLFRLERSYEFRFEGASSEQRAVILAAWSLGLDLGVVARYSTSTCNLKAAPAEVDEVLKWTRLTQAVAEAVAAAASSPFLAAASVRPDPSKAE